LDKPFPNVHLFWWEGAPSLASATDVAGVFRHPSQRGFGDERYSKEELVAEMGAAFLCAIAGIANEHTDRNTTAYIQNWIEKLEEDTSRDEVRS